VDGVELEVEQLSDPQAAGPLQQERVSCEPVQGCVSRQRRGQLPVGIDGQVARQRLGLVGQVAAEQELPAGCLIPTR
jgi:hypothetical protein